MPVDEIIIVDDGSNDNTSEVVNKYGNSIRYIWQENSGPAAARNRGILEARGVFIAFLDSDDIWVKDKMEIQMDFFKRNPHLDIVFGLMANFNGMENKELPEIKNMEIYNYLIKHQADLKNIFEFLISENVIPTPSVVLKRSCIDRIGLFDESLRNAEDYDYWLRAARTCRFGFVDAILVKRRRHENNLVNDWVARTKAHAEVLAMAQKKFEDLPPRSQKLLIRRLSNTNYDLGSYFYKKGDYENSYIYLRKGRPGKEKIGPWVIKILVAIMMKKLKVKGNLMTF